MPFALTTTTLLALLLAACDDGKDDTGPTDADGDGWTLAEGDCDDRDPEAHPGASEVWYDGMDQDCTGGDDYDSDGDGWEIDTWPAGSGHRLTDCDDTTPNIHPEAPEVVADGIDQDCDGGDVCFEDRDGDGYGTESTVASPDLACTDHRESTVSTDCDVEDAAVHPNAPEVAADGIDQDCDGGDTCWRDVDADGDSWAGTDMVASEDLDCKDPGEASAGGDCNEADPAVNPGAADACGDGLDQDCDGRDRRCAIWGDVDLADADARLIGEDASDDAGTSVAGAGDVDADGYGDVLVGAPRASPTGFQQGAAYLVYGSVTGDLDLSLADAWLVGEEPYDYAGQSVAGAGDVDADGYDDVLVGAGGYTDADYSGVAFLVYGPMTGDVAPSMADARLLGSDRECAGSSVAGAGDVDADGYDDVLVGASGHFLEDGGYYEVFPVGAAYLVRGPVAGDVDLFLADARLLGEEVQDDAGSAVSGAGDVDGDGYDDVLIGAPHSSWWSKKDVTDSPGKAYVITGPISGDFDLGDTDARIIGIEPSDHLGISVARAGDVDADGYDDILVGALGFGSGGTAILLLGPVSGSLDLYDADARLDGEEGVVSGRSVAGAGDVDADGYDDVLVGDPYNHLGGDDSGAAFLVYSPLAGVYSLADAEARLIGEDQGDNAGGAVAGAGDVDADGQADLLVGAPGSDLGGGSTGCAYLLLGRGW